MTAEGTSIHYSVVLVHITACNICVAACCSVLRCVAVCCSVILGRVPDLHVGTMLRLL